MLKQSLLHNIKEDQEFIQSLEVALSLSHEIENPSVIDNSVDEPKGVTVTIVACELCKRPFAILDVLVAPCHCTYHPWCAVRQN